MTIKLSELTVDAYKVILERTFDNRFEAIEKMYWKNTKQLGIELTGKDITKNEDVLCIRRTHDACTECRFNKESVKKTIITQGVKSFAQWILILLALGLALIQRTIKP